MVTQISQSRKPDAKEQADAYAGVGSSQHGLELRLPQSDEPLVKIDARLRRHLFAKRVFDILVSGLMLAALFPLFAVVALAIKMTSRGPVLFLQEREGLRGAPFKVFKFRTMRLEDSDFSGVAQTVRGDPRITPVGRFLRQTSIDELPQLLNVLIGEMSLVGPRPHVRGMGAGGMRYNELVPYYNRRLEMPPGITGWAQAHGLRGPTDRASTAWARVDHDIAYIQNFSFWLDVQIILLTLRREFFGGSGF